MVNNKCAACGCTNGNNKKHEQVHGFSFPIKKTDLLTKWIKFVNRTDWKPTENSIACMKRFKDEFIKNGKRMK